MRIALDLFCGTGAATAAFVGCDDWKVIGVDLERRASIVRVPDVIADVRRLPFGGSVDFVWASPPCNEFSTMPPGRSDRRPSLDLIFATLSAVRDLRPRFWILENVRGAIPFLGIPRQKIGPFCLWGYFPKIKAPLEVCDYRKITPANRSAVERAAIPAALARAVFESVERSWNKKTILDMRPYRRHRHIAKLARPGPAWRPSVESSTATRPEIDRRVAVGPGAREGHVAGCLAPRATATWPSRSAGMCNGSGCLAPRATATWPVDVLPVAGRVAVAPAKTIFGIKVPFNWKSKI